jgi:hypothetical protein
VSDTNVCHPTAYHRHHSIPRSVTRLRTIWIRLVEHSAVGGCQGLILLLHTATKSREKICCSTDIKFVFYGYNVRKK